MEYETICNQSILTYLECMNKPPIATPITPITTPIATLITQIKKDKTKCKKEFDACNKCIREHTITNNPKSY